MDYQKTLETIYGSIRQYEGLGEQATYIPYLAKVDPDQFGICLNTVEGGVYTLGNDGTPFSIQSISKVFSLACALSMTGEDIWKRVGKEPSGTKFNSLVQLEAEHGIPRNPFINAGALVIADILMSSFRNPENDFITFVRTLCGNPAIDYNRPAAKSERSNAYLNAAIANMLKYHDNIKGGIEDVLGFYFLICSIEMSCRDLASAFLPFANHKRPFDYAGIRLTSSQVKRINAIMQTCGFYDEAGEFSYLVGLPGKSGVGGGIAAVSPQKYSVAVWSPRLNEKGNSIMGIKALEMLTTITEESVF